MKNASLAAAAALLALALAQMVSAQGRQAGDASAPSSVIATLAGDVQADWAVQKELVVNAADAMPNDKFGYKSTPAVISL